MVNWKNKRPSDLFKTRYLIRGKSPMLSDAEVKPCFGCKHCAWTKNSDWLTLALSSWSTFCDRKPYQTSKRYTIYLKLQLLITIITIEQLMRQVKGHTSRLFSRFGVKMSWNSRKNLPSILALNINRETITSIWHFFREQVRNLKKK